jgi:NTE family protein
MTLREWLRERPYTLALSSGFFGFFAHAGALSVLEEEGLLPARVCGSSAGALVAGLWAAGLPARRICEELLALRREHFWDPSVGIGLLRGRLFRERLHALLPARTFSEARAPVAVSVFDVLGRRTRVLREGSLAEALHASCAVPFLFQPVWIARRPYADGGVLDRPGLASAAPGERVLHHHLASKSPWRFSLKRPRAENLWSVSLDGLPRLGPFRLSHARDAMDKAAAGFRRELGTLSR